MGAVMKRFSDLGILMLLCLFFLCVPAFSDISPSFVAALLLALIFSSLTFLDLPGHFRQLLYAVLLLSAFWIPELSCFFPVLLYCHHFRRERILPCMEALFSIYAFVVLFKFSPVSCCFLAVLCFASLVLEQRTSQAESLTRLLYQIQDTSAETALLLQEKNKALLDKQDTEVYAATLRERNRIAREIHDNVGHLLSRSILLAGALKTIVTDPAVLGLLSQLDGTLNEAMDSIRTSVHDLKDDSIDLKTALENLVSSFTFCQAVLSFNMTSRIPRDVKYTCLAICREALNNVMRHSNADKVQITVREHPSFYQLVISDNGTRKTDISVSSGMGLSSMQERIQALNGVLRIQTETGFRIFITIPKKENFL